MKIGIVIGTNEAEVVWNAFRFGNVSLKANHEVKIFLMNKGVEVESITDEKFNVKEQITQYMGSKGQILACGTCLKIREKEGSDICPISTMKDLLKLVEESDKILTFG
ncbi:MAG TPA: DsrE family protein [Candidatus Nanoarchaeia archaeon]|nr:DsrE family protein [Candidatus Nanoarchaeia archaeon]